MSAPITNTDKKKMVVPKLRFKEFEDSWNKKKLGDIVKITSASRVHKDEWTEKGVPFFRSSDVVAAFKGTINTKAYISFELYTSLSNKIGRVKKDDLLITGGGSIGIPYLIKNDEPLYFKDADLLWIKTTNEISGYFLYSFFLTQSFENYINITSHVGTIAHYTVIQAKNTPFHYPSLPEQQKIASFLSAVDEKIMQLTRKKELLEQYKKGVMQQFFSGKLRFKDENGKAFPKWEKKRLGELTTRIGDGIHSTPVYDDNGVYYFVNGNNLTSGKILINESTKKVSESEYLKHYRVLGEKTILLSINGTIGNIAFYDNEKIVLGKSACYININDTVDLRYIYLLIQSSSIINYFNSELTGSTIKNLSLKTVRETPINLPCLEEQKKIANYLSNIDNKIESVNNQISQTQTFKKGLLQQMFV